MTNTVRVLEHLCEALVWLEAAQHGDPNGAKAYQAAKFVKEAIDLITGERP